MTHSNPDDAPESTGRAHRLTTVYGSCGDMAQRWAVLVPCCGPAKGDGSDDQIRAAVADLIDRRRKRFAQLRKRGWEYLQTGNNWNYALNCPPITVRTSRGNIPCHQKLICPFCWARNYALETFQRLEFMFCDTGQRLAQPSRKLQGLRYDLVEVYTTTTYEDCDPAEILAEIKREGNQLVRSQVSLGAFSLYSVTPLPRNWRVEHRVLWVVRTNDIRKSDIKAMELKDVGLVRTAHPIYVTCRSDLAGAAARICKYPVELMTVNAMRMVDLLQAHAASNVRLSAYYGELRNVSERKRRTEWAAGQNAPPPEQDEEAE